MCPFSSISIFSATGTFGSPGIVKIFPVIITINPAPAFKTTSSTCMLNCSLHSKFLGLSDNEYCVFAIHTGNFLYPIFSIKSIFSFAFLEISISFAPYISFDIFFIFSSILSSKLYIYLKLFFCSAKSTTFFAKSIAPSPTF